MDWKKLFKLIELYTSHMPNIYAGTMPHLNIIETSVLQLGLFPQVTLYTIFLSKNVLSCQFGVHSQLPILSQYWLSFNTVCLNNPPSYCLKFFQSLSKGVFYTLLTPLINICWKISHFPPLGKA